MSTLKNATHHPLFSLHKKHNLYLLKHKTILSLLTHKSQSTQLDYVIIIN